VDVINAISVTQPANVNNWIETDDDEVQDALYWRQAFDCRNLQLSSVELICKCETPANPDKILIGCTSSTCGKWLHYECLLDDLLLRVYEQLGTTKPHITQQPLLKEEKDDEKGTRPLSPTETGGEDAQPTIDVRGAEASKNALVKQADGGTPRTAQTPTPGPVATLVETPTKPVVEKKRRKKKNSDYKPYQGLFEASLKMNDGPTIWEIKDLRENVSGGEKTWTEQVRCLVCSKTIE
ncbi:hypothetical protein B0I35DRAFT_365619, partial [Stachybotrys elegans]